jgi:deazaflavin-dependent oxidoreductase (nitroreductase family)
VTRRFVAWLPGFAVLRYVGRRSGTAYRTPINVFERDGDYVFALTYGADVDWVKNILASGTAQLERAGRVIDVRDPRLFADPKASLMPLPIRLFLRSMRVTEFLRMSPAPSPSRDQGEPVNRQI